MNIPTNQCQYPGEEHPLEDTAMGGDSCIYQDDVNGIPEMIRCCKYHYKIHILKYWPESRIAAYFRKQDEGKVVQGSLLENTRESDQ